MSKFRLTTILRSVENYKLWGGVRIGPFSTLQKYKKNSLKSLRLRDLLTFGYLCLSLVTFGYLSWPY